MDISSAQCRAARALIGISQQGLADAAKVSKRTIASFELGDTVLPAMRASLRAALEAAGVEFIPENGGGAGVRLKKQLQTVNPLDLNGDEREAMKSFLSLSTDSNGNEVLVGLSREASEWMIAYKHRYNRGSGLRPAKDEKLKHVELSELHGKARREAVGKSV